MLHPRLFLLSVVTGVGLALVPRPAAAQAGCEPIMKAMAAEMKQPAWHRTVDMKTPRATMTFELIKADGQMYRRMGGGAWAKMPITAAGVNEMSGEMLASGKLKLSGCSRVGEEAVDGARAAIFEYTSTLEGMAKPYSARVWIGVADSLPYKMLSDTQTMTTVYKGVTAPK